VRVSAFASELPRQGWQLSKPDDQTEFQAPFRANPLGDQPPRGIFRDCLQRPG